MHHPTGVLEDGQRITLDMVREEVKRELGRLHDALGEGAFRKGHYEQAAKLLERLTADPRFATFLTLSAYREID